MSSDNTYRDNLIKQTDRLTWRALAQIYLETYIPVFALSLVFVGLFFIGSFGGIWERIGDPWRGLMLIAAFVLLLMSARRAYGLVRPNISAARRRVEIDNGASHRPIDTLHDAPALSPDLWPQHYQNTLKILALLHPSRLRPFLRAMDPYFIRFMLPVALMLSLMVGYGDNFERLRHALNPGWISGMSAKNAKFDAWADPPKYTARPPIYFQDKKFVDVPEGSELVARISGMKDAPRLKIISDNGTRYVRTIRLGPKSFEARTQLREGSVTARWRLGSDEKSWDINVLADRAPSVEFNDLPKADKRDRLAFTYTLDDDYGVEQLELEIQLLTDDPQKSQEIERVDVPLSQGSVRKAERAPATLDLTKHVWAGKKARARLIARDGKGQTAKTEDVFFIVPDKIFIEPLAKAIVEQRSLIISADQDYAPPRRLTRDEVEDLPVFDSLGHDNRLGRAPAPVQRAALLMAAVTEMPSGLYEDPAVFMGLKNVLGRLRYADDQGDLIGVPEDLWSIAIRAEFGVLGSALEEMIEAQRALQDAIARRAPQREVDTLFERYNQAVDRYMEELRRQAEEEGNFSDGDNPEGGGGGLESLDEIQELLDAIEEANRIGDTEGARLALAQLAELLENLEIQLNRGGGGGGGGEPSESDLSEEAQEALEDLADLLGEQRELKDETERAEEEELRQQFEQEQGGGQSNQGQSGQNQSGETGSSGDSEGDSGATPELDAQALARQQDQIERALEAIREGLSEDDLNAIPAPARGGQEGQGQDQGAGGGEEQGADNPGSGGFGDDTNDDSNARGGGGDDSDEDRPSLTPGEALEQAIVAMQNSQNALTDNDLARASREQRDAIEALREAAQSLARSGQAGQEGQNGQQADGGQGDPLGRNDENGNTDPNFQTDLEQRDNAKRSKELLEELRRRASEQEREQIEKEYLDRLLKRF